MDPKTKVWLLLAGIAAACAGFYGLLWWMDKRGWVNFRGTIGGAAGAAHAFREFVDPPARHVVEVRDSTPRPPALGDPPPDEYGKNHPT